MWQNSTPELSDYYKCVRHKTNYKLSLNLPYCQMAFIGSCGFKKLNIMNDNFFDWWEAFTELAYSKNLTITKNKDVIRDKWYNKEFTIEEGIKRYTR